LSCIKCINPTPVQHKHERNIGNFTNNGIEIVAKHVCSYKSVQETNIRSAKCYYYNSGQQVMVGMSWFEYGMNWLVDRQQQEGWQWTFGDGQNVRI